MSRGQIEKLFQHLCEDKAEKITKNYFELNLKFHFYKTVEY